MISEKIEGRLKGILGVSQRFSKDSGLNVIHFSELLWRNWSTRHGWASLIVSHACKDSHGMMGSGKTTVGKILSEALAYSFVDSDKYVEEALGGSPVAQIFNQFDILGCCSDKYVEEALGGSPVAQIFNQFGESFFRDYESDALRTFSLMPRQVVATGGGAVVRPINWKYMREGVTVYLDVPLDSLARRIAAVGTGSRPLLNFVSGDVYTKAFMGLFKISKKRSLAYENADATVYLQNIAAKLGVEDLSDITPTAITLESNKTRHSEAVDALSIAKPAICKLDMALTDLVYATIFLPLIFTTIQAELGQSPFLGPLPCDASLGWDCITLVNGTLPTAPDYLALARCMNVPNSALNVVLNVYLATTQSPMALGSSGPTKRSNLKYSLLSFALTHPLQTSTFKISSATASPFLYRP
ncbi:hypothetical protein TEA_027948 [Camellia sinensis var. sinensis]|uniref:shikimate kinase n=1 Tax=Camellia sinensis var. sinensis TaxID=542762 RepID=A0A4S4DPJ8_CAMSN|nr:hypothetical protein TEA_027948 [Camellia sinensis var. sinensis]